MTAARQICLAALNQKPNQKPNQKKYQSNIKSTQKSPNQIFSFYI